MKRNNGRVVKVTTSQYLSIFSNSRALYVWWTQRIEEHDSVDQEASFEERLDVLKTEP